MTENASQGSYAEALPDSGPPRPVVGIGASAGGLESLKQFFTAMPANSGAAFVVVQHLQHGRESMMRELIAGYTKMPVQDAEEGAQAAANTVYILPPDRLVTIHDGFLHLETWTGHLPQRAPIDEFFRALAADQGRNAVAIVMSGALSDGTLGVRAVKEYGGMALAEHLEPNRASEGFDSMPQSAWATGVVDFAVPAREMPEHIVAYARYLRDLLDARGLAQAESEASKALGPIQTLLLDRKGRDFRDYKPNTLIRRIQRRMQILRLDTADDYLNCLRTDPMELEHVSAEFLIGVTSFFRDPDAFEALKTMALDPLIRSRRYDQGVRIWVAGCSTGEEAYSIAILAQEMREELNTFVPVRIFATDIDPVAIDTARTGLYPSAVAADISPERLKRFFSREDDHYRVRKDVRNLCVFSEHDIIQDPPFWQMDLIACRNFLIYLDSNFQKRFNPIIHYALRASGYLFLGASENVTQHPNLFKVVDKTHRIFQRRDEVVRPEVTFPVQASPSVKLSEKDNRLPAQAPFAQRVERLVLQRHAPAHVVVDDNFAAVHFSRGTGLFLEQPGGAPRSNIFDLIHAGLRTALRTALYRARKSQEESAQCGLSLASELGELTVDVVVTPFTANGERSFFLVVFKRVDPPVGVLEATAATDDVPDPTPTVAESGESRVRALERELAATRADLQATIEELETSNEELQSTNEELRSMNEELQSANEELQSSKEEIQSVNEELDRKVVQLNEVNDDLNNLLESTDLATVFLDGQLRIKWFAPAARRIFRLINTDVGRPIADITARFDTEALESDLRAVLREHSARERDVTLPDRGETYRMRLRPYWPSSGEVNGVVMTFQNVTDLTEAGRKQRMLVAALQHRVRNILSTVRSLARESRESSDSLDHFFERFDGRLNALATSESIVTRTGERRVDLAELVQEAVPDALSDGARLNVRGESVMLDTRASQMIALALNELATNAIKFGALGESDGTVDLSWTARREEGETWLNLVWHETGIRPGEQPGPRGFGLDLIETGVPYELGGTGAVTFDAEALTCTLDVPVDRAHTEGSDGDHENDIG